MEIKTIKINQLKPHPKNPRVHPDSAINKLVRSITEFGWTNPILVSEDSYVLAGHARLKAAEKAGLKEVPVIYLPMNGAKAEAYMIADNRLQDETDWDFTKLADLITDLDDGSFDLELTGFDIDEIEELMNWTPDNDKDVIHKKLTEQFIVPPFSILDTRQGYWQERKRTWMSLIEDKGESREKALDGLKSLARYGVVLPTVSILDPVLAEIVLRWFNIEKSTTFDPFAGDTVFGFVSSYLGYKFKGIELRKEQCEINQARCDTYKLPAEYFCDDGQNVLNYIKPESQDMLFSCPPFYDLEVYSDLPNDASNQGTYEEFLSIIETAFSNSIKGLKDNRFAVIVCQDIRDKQGFYRGFPGHIRDIFEKKGVRLYNRLVLINSVGSAPVRAANYMRNRKVVSLHQYVLVFYKGNPKAIKNEFNTDKAICSDG